MMYIEIEDNEGEVVKTTWSTDSPFPCYDPKNVQVIRADEEELGIVLNTFDNLVKSRLNVQLWYGDLARTIFAHLQYSGR